MATLALTDDELTEVRLQLGNRVTTTDLSDAQIRSQTVLGAASDYVLEKVREGLDLNKLTDAERTIAERIRDESADDIANFVNVLLKPPQRSQFRRAVIFRTAGMCAPLVSTLLSESAAGIAQRIQARPWEVIQANLFLRSDEEINLLRDAFPDDAFPTEEESVKARGLYELFTVTESS